ncbi:MAG TPA: hypothetical protein VGA44_03160 [Steroidobacteraceae bacterium]
MRIVIQRSQATSLRGRNLASCGVVEKLPKAFAEPEFAVLPPDLHARTAEEPENVVTVPNPEVFVDHARLVLEEDILKSTEQADSDVAKLAEFVLGQCIRIDYSNPKYPGTLLIATNDSGQLRERGSGEVIGL